MNVAEDKRYVWHVEGTTPSVWKHPTSGEERPTTKNFNLTVVASADLVEVIDAVKHRHRDTTVTFVKVWRERPIDGVVIAGA